MPLDEVARRYADTLFAAERNRLWRDQANRAVNRGPQDGFAFINDAGVSGVEFMEALAHARADTLVAAYLRARLPIDDQAVAEIATEVDQVCRIQSGAIIQNIHDVAIRTGMGGGIGTAMSQHIAMESDRISADVRQRLSAKRDEAILDTRIAPAQVAEPEQVDDLLPIFPKRQFDVDLLELASVADASAPLSLVFIDIDHFKQVNDCFGHAVGDEVLIGTASTIKSVCNGKGRCYRWGGDELAVLLPNHNLSEAQSVAVRMRETVSGLELKGYSGKITLSIGIASYPDSCDSSEELFKCADEAVYAAKNGGRDRICIAGPVDSPASAPTAPRLSPDEAKKRVEKLRVWVRLVRGRADNFLLSIENKSDEDILVEEIRLESGGYPITEPAFPLIPEAWKVLAKCTLPIGWLCQTDPAVSLTRMNDNEGLFFKAELRVVVVCNILGQSRECEQKIPVQVKVTNREIVSLV